MADFDRKVAFAIKLLQSIPKMETPIEISYSGGKDSDVILELAKMADIRFEAIYKNTTIDPPGTIKHCRDMGVTILNPKMTFFQLIEKKGFPTRRARFCCEVLKEYKVYDQAVQGVRRAESTARANRYHEPEMCRVYSKTEKTRIYFPILEWTSEDVERFVKWRGLQLAPVYYDEDGTFHVERRLGCVGCPLKSDCGKSDFKKYPKMLKAWLRAGKVYMDTHPHSRAVAKFATVYGMMVHDLFFDSFEGYEQVYGGGNSSPKKPQTRSSSSKIILALT